MVSRHLGEARQACMREQGRRRGAGAYWHVVVPHALLQVAHQLHAALLGITVDMDGQPVTASAHLRGHRHTGVRFTALCNRPCLPRPRHAAVCFVSITVSSGII